MRKHLRVSSSLFLCLHLFREAGKQHKPSRTSIVNDSSFGFVLLFQHKTRSDAFSLFAITSFCIFASSNVNNTLEVNVKSKSEQCMTIETTSSIISVLQTFQIKLSSTNKTSQTNRKHCTKDWIFDNMFDSLTSGRMKWASPDYKWH